MDVIATQTGYYGQLRTEGEPFALNKASDFSPRWMKKFGAKGAEPAQKDAPPKPRTRRTNKVDAGEAKSLKEVQDAQADAGHTENWAE